MNKPPLSLPLIGLGTWKLSGRECTKVVEQALDIGYRHIDTAHSYENHKAIGKALSRAKREELFLTSKFGLDSFDLSDVEKSCMQALKELKTDYLDLYLLHWPDRSKPMADVLKAMYRLQEAGHIRALGVSNCTTRHLEELVRVGVPIAANQVEFHPYLYQKELWHYCQERQIALIAYRPLGKGLLVEEPLFTKIGAPYGKSPAQVILRWIVQKKIPVIAKASTLRHLAENFAINDFALTPEESHSLDLLHRGQRFCSPGWQDFLYI